MKPQDFIHELNRMCTYYKGQCEPNHCELYDIGCYINGDTKDEDFAKMYDTVEAWSDAHSIETRQDRFLKLFPYVRMSIIANRKTKVIDICPNVINCNAVSDDECECHFCGDCKIDYWLAPVDGK